MTRKAIFISAIAVFILFSVPVYSIEIASFENNEGRTFYPGDVIDLGVVLINNESGQVNLIVEQDVSIPDTVPMPLYEIFVIGPGNNTMIADLSFAVSDNSRPGEYAHMVRVYVGDDLIGEKITLFYINGTTIRFSDYGMVICADEKCDDVKSSFNVGETVYIKVESAQNPIMEGFLDMPDGNHTVMQISGGMAQFIPVSAGTYKINVVLSKDGFAPETIEKEITVTGEMTGESLTGEVPQNPFVWLIVGFAAAVVIAVIAALLRRHKGK
ncbi:MAG: hypothetical protein V1648_04670 [Candidatus Aenigmatarchaeota archaeon]